MKKVGYTLFFLVAIQSVYADDALKNTRKKIFKHQQLQRFNPLAYPWSAASWGLMAWSIYSLEESIHEAERADEGLTPAWVKRGVQLLCGISCARGAVRILSPAEKQEIPQDIDDFTQLQFHLEESVEDSKLCAVSYLLELFDAAEIAPSTREIVLRSLLETAEHKLAEKRSSIRFLASWRDIMTTAVGLYYMPYAWSGYVQFSQEENPLFDESEAVKKKNDAWWHSAYALGGAYCVYKGLTCGSRRWYLEDAQAIVELLKKRLPKEQ